MPMVNKIKKPQEQLDDEALRELKKIEAAGKQRRKYFRGFIYGTSQTGKTLSAVTTSPEPVFVHTFNAGALDSVQPYIEDSDYRIYCEELIQEDDNLLDTYFNRMEYLKGINFFKNIATYVFDNTTDFSEIIKDKAFTEEAPKSQQRFLNAVNAMSDYEYQRTQFIKLARTVLPLPCHVIILGHKREKDMGQGMFKETIAMPPAARDAFLQLMSEVYRTEIVTNLETNAKKYTFVINLSEKGLVGGTRGNKIVDGKPVPILRSIEPQNFRYIFKKLGLDYEDKQTQTEERENG